MNKISLKMKNSYSRKKRNNSRNSCLLKKSDSLRMGLGRLKKIGTFDTLEQHLKKSLLGFVTLLKKKKLASKRKGKHFSNDLRQEGHNNLTERNLPDNPRERLLNEEFLWEAVCGVAWLTWVPESMVTSFSKEKKKKEIALLGSFEGGTRSLEIES